MKLTLGTSSYKQFQKIIRLLAKTSDEINISAQPDNLVLKAINTTETAYCTCKLSESFFLEYRITSDKSDEENDEANNCVVSAKPLIFTFKSTKNVVSCTITIEDERLVIVTTKARGCLTRNSVHIHEYEEFQDMDPPTDHKTIEAHCSLFSQILKNFPRNLNDLSVAMFPDRIELSNHISHPEKDVQTVRMNFQICANELHNYEIQDEHRLIVSTENFMALLEAGQSFNDEMSLIFTKNGKPLIMKTISKDRMVHIEMILSTMREETLKKTRKLPEAQSYRELVVSYIENREKKKRDQNESQNHRNNLSDTEMNRVCSPAIDSDTFNGGMSKRTNSKQNPQRKTSADEVEVVLSNNKRAKVTGNYTQEDLNSVSKILDDLENFDPDEDDEMQQNNVLGCMKNFKLPAAAAQQRETVESRLSASQTPSSVDSRKSASVQRAVDMAEDAADEDVPMANVERTNFASRTSDNDPTPRFHLADMNFPSEDLEQAEKSPVRQPTTRTRNSKLAQLKEQRKQNAAKMKNIFKGSQTSPADNVVLIPNSDSESD